MTGGRARGAHMNFETHTHSTPYCPHFFVTPAPLTGR